jgi:hypothetical protein
MYRFHQLWYYGRLPGIAADGNLKDHLRKYSTFKHVLMGGGCAHDPKKYQPYNRKWKADFYRQENPRTTVGFDLETLRRATVNRLAREVPFFQPERGEEWNRWAATEILRAEGYFEKRDQMIVASRKHQREVRDLATIKWRDGRWVWSWPFEGGEIRNAVRTISKATKGKK